VVAYAPDEKTGKAGYVEMAKDDNTAGWILTTLVYPRRADGEGHRHEGNRNAEQPQTVTRYMLKEMRWTTADGLSFDYGWSRSTRPSPPKHRMYVSGSDVQPRQASKIDPSLHGGAAVEEQERRCPGGARGRGRADANAARRLRR
jgi:hypothetical protein